MYERLDKLRDELKRAEKRKEDADKKLKIAQDRLREAESTQILADVEALHLTPDQVGQFLSMAANGQLPDWAWIRGSQTLRRRMQRQAASQERVPD